jgi:hypothetical protein
LDAVHEAVRYDLGDNGKAIDPFAPARAVKFEGRPFRIEVPFREEDTVHETPGWFYANGQLRLSWGTSDGFVIDDAYRDKGGWVGENGFGATVNVDASEHMKVFLEPQGQGAAAIVAKLPLDGPKAKALALNAVAVIEGTITDLEPRDKGDRNHYTTYLRDDGFDIPRPVSCATKYYGATFESPSTIEETRCHVGVKLTRITFVNRATHETVWSQDYK